jgi:hypothetical protein
MVFDLWPPFQIRKELNIASGDIEIPVALLPRQYIDGTLRIEDGIRCKIVYGKMTSGGGYAKIYRAKRIAEHVTDICVKVPHANSFSVCPEAILQWLALESLKGAGIEGAIPQIYDIFQYAGETRMTMSYIEGVSSLEYILTSAMPERALIQIIIQTCLLLGFLEESIRLDHRDLKADNIWIRSTPVDYSVNLGGKIWRVVAPFQVVLLDFGFGCLGSTEGNAVISLSDGILPKFDPCPKEGRDVFQFLASLWSCPLIRSLMSEAFQKDIEELLSYKNKPYASLMKQTLDTRWIYLLVSDSLFRHPPLHPLSLLSVYSIKYGSEYIVSE